MRALLLFGPVLVVGVVAAVVTIGHRDADPLFIAAQRRPPAITASALSRVVVGAREPLPGGRGRPGRRARCRPGATRGPLHNPWSCAVRFASGRTVRYRIRVRPDGTFHGANRSGDAIIDGRVHGPDSG